MSDVADEHAFAESLEDDFPVLWTKKIGRHPNTIAYPENFFESAQIIATHSHLRWPDLSREWIRRQQARIARVDWESRQPLILGPRKSRLNLFTRKQQKILKKAREMDETPDLSALLKGKLQLLKKSTTQASPANPTGGSISQGLDPSYPIDQVVDPDPPGSKPKKKSQKKKKSKGTPSGGNNASGEKAVTLEGSTDDSSMKKKKTKKAKRSREDLGDREDLDNDSSKGASGENPKKKKKSKKEGRAEKVQQSPGLEEAPVVQGSPRVGEEVVGCDSQEKAPSEGALVRMESPGGARVPPVEDRGTAPNAVTLAPLKRPRIDFSTMWSSDTTRAHLAVCNPARRRSLRQPRPADRERPCGERPPGLIAAKKGATPEAPREGLTPTRRRRPKAQRKGRCYSKIDRGEKRPDSLPLKEGSCPRTGEEDAEEGRSLVREDPLSGIDPEKVVEIDDSSLGDEEEDAEETQSPTPAETGEPLRDQEGLGLAEKLLSPASVEQEGPRGRNEDGMVPVDAPESRTVPEDVEVAEELDADLHVVAEETHV
ncbi:hypothetical protein Bca52824_080047 [Brassica carinata]|uniref:Uncharacterized protein n=1 Tax=Brassica carinata TaxID=52824 RepID=A0A8X7Q0R8_BRACI|nr:hypothetical protein Bca52824_080047 [Brassica carinata]